MAYKANLHATTNKPLGIAQGVPTDARSYFYDEAQYIYRVYASVEEVLAYLDTNASRAGHFSVFVTIEGVIKEYWFRDGTEDAHLVEKTGAGAKDNYQLWLDAGNVGSYDDYFEASRGPEGPVSTVPGPPSSVPGPPGKSAYELWLQIYPGGTLRDYIAYMEGKPGSPSTVPGPVGPASIVPGPQGPPAFPWIILAVLEANEPLPPGGNPNFAYGKKDEAGNIHTWVWVPAVGSYVDFGTLGDATTVAPFIPIAENQYGEHPAFNTQRDIDIFLLSKTTTPQTAGYGLVDDFNNTFSAI